MTESDDANLEVSVSEERWVPAAAVEGYTDYCPILPVFGSLDSGEFVFENYFNNH